ncbi:DUF262 domain-containing protein [Chitinophaga sp. HK235]|uniref:DUF262 domain-containing protein n=1 Tax=Chitinophaga sp. HK235 TaxID=2952571 RepID=UPI001BA8A314|nr:DUF262 domain-containing protein [Chitinophaga sp. HK235]
MAQTPDQIVSLIQSIETISKNVHTQSLDLSFNEILDMRKNNELDITPDFQRLFRWTEGARSRFIESLLLEMPVPPIYVVEVDDGRYLLIDGLQRISSYLHLRGHLEADHLDNPVKLGDMLVLTDCDIVKELNGKTFDDLGTALQIRLKRAFVRVEVVRKGSDPHFKYHMFKRLNTGGEVLSPQQIRNCTIRLLNPQFIDFIKELSQEGIFKQCTEYLTYEQKMASFDQELVLRFFALKNNREEFKHDVGDFLTDYMEAISEPDDTSFNYDEEKTNFLKTFTVLYKTLGEFSFGYANKKREGELTKAFGIYHFESFTIGLQKRINQMQPEDDAQMESLKNILIAIKHDADFIAMTTGGGKNSKGLLISRIGFVEEKVENLFI